MGERGFSQVLIITAIILLVTIGYFFSQLQISSTNINGEVSILDTTNWKTYTNNVYQLSLKYPSSWQVYKCGGETTSKSNQIADPADGTELECVFWDDGSKETGNITHISLNFDKMSFDYVNSKDVSQGTLTAIGQKRAYVSINEASGSTTERNKQVYIEKSPTELISLVGNYDNSTSIAFFDTILSTLQFK